jgi:hypothetical protein
VKGKPQEVVDSLPAFGKQKLLTGPAPATNLPAPQLTIESDTQTAGIRTLHLLLKPQRQVRLITLHVAVRTPVTAATVDGRPLPTDKEAGGEWGFGFTFHAPPPSGVQITLSVRTAAPIKFRTMDASDGLSALPGFTPRPADIGIVGSHLSETLAIAKTYTL